MIQKIFILFAHYVHKFTGVIFCQESALAEACKHMLNIESISAPRTADCFNSEYYQKLHNNNKYYQRNNWLLDDIQALSSSAIAAKTVIELACGNGHFCRSIAGQYDKVTAIDWAASPELVNLPENVTFLKKYTER